MKCGVVTFPGSNCDHDVYHVLKHVLGHDVRFLWHGDDSLDGVDLVVLPGGFSYGDYLRSGAMAALAPMVDAVREHAAQGGLVLGICNGFQILCEAGLLPGALRRNAGLRFECRDVGLRIERTDTPFTSEFDAGEVIALPIAHGEGRYVDSPENLDALEARDGVVFRYVGLDGSEAEADGPDAGGSDPLRNVNGSARSIAGIVDEGGTVLGMMPHPERASEAILGNTDGLRIFTSALGRLEGAA